MGTTQRSEATSGWLAVGFLILVALILLVADPFDGGSDGGAIDDAEDDFPFVAYIAPLEAPSDPTFGFGDDVDTGDDSDDVDEVLGRTESSAGLYHDMADPMPASPRESAPVPVEVVAGAEPTQRGARTVAD